MEKWFLNTLRKVMKYNDYNEDMTTVIECNRHKVWTPCDLIAREYLNNGGGSAKGFLGITTNACIKAYNYMKTIKRELIQQGMLSENGYSNFGLILWLNYNI